MQCCNTGEESRDNVESRIVRKSARCTHCLWVMGIAPKGLTHEDTVRLFKAAFGEELTPEMVKDYGFKVSPELEKAAFGKVKIADLAVGELVAVIQPSAREVADKPRPPGEKVSLIGALGEIRTPDPRNRNP